jgi:hypothetical protein
VEGEVERQRASSIVKPCDLSEFYSGDHPFLLSEAERSWEARKTIQMIGKPKPNCKNE